MSPVPRRFHGREISCDSFYCGLVRVYQPRRGWRFSVDAPILAAFIDAQPKARAVEVGGGCGIVSLLLLWKGALRKVTVFELQAYYASLCAVNARANGFGRRLEAVCGDYLMPENAHPPADLVFSNPPFFDPGCGRISPNPEIALAKWETGLSVESLLAVVKNRLAPAGRLAMILPGFREEGYRRMFGKFSFYIERYRGIKPFSDSKTERFLVQLSTEPVVEERQPSLILFSGFGVYSAEMNTILRGQ